MIQFPMVCGNQMNAVGKAYMCTGFSPEGGYKINFFKKSPAALRSLLSKKFNFMEIFLRGSPLAPPLCTCMMQVERGKNAKDGKCFKFFSRLPRTEQNLNFLCEKC